MMRAFSCAVAGSAEGRGVTVVVVVVVVVPEEEEEDSPLAFAFLAAGFLAAAFGDLGDVVGGSSGLDSGMGWGLRSMVS
jgi:hypothetical protein